MLPEGKRRNSSNRTFCERRNLPLNVSDVNRRDGVHLTSAGYEVLFRKFTEVLIETSPELNPELMKHRVPE